LITSIPSYWVLCSTLYPVPSFVGCGTDLTAIRAAETPEQVTEKAAQEFARLAEYLPP
jgi:hypothetical protein